MQPSDNTSAALSRTEEAVHPGRFVRETVLEPRKMSVTDAAKHIGVSRPGVSNFLNGKVSATPQMASRIERAFGVPAQKLLDMQAAYDVAGAKARGAPANARTYVPVFLQFKANDIVRWATNNISARSRFAVLLRTLVHSTGAGLSQVDFPGNDDAERPGWDGYVVASEGTPWVPEGRSGWEFGTNQDPVAKAEKDFAKSVKATKKSERIKTTFIFVTTQEWKGKNAWREKARKAGQWKDVRAYDAQDLEQWFAQSLPAQAWFANETKHPAEGVRSLDDAWQEWAGVSRPPLPGALFEAGIKAAKRTVETYLSKPPTGPLVVTADSVEEVLAFVSQLFSERGGDKLSGFRDRTLIFEEPSVLPRLAQTSQGFIVVTANRDVERELATLSHELHAIVAYPRNASVSERHVTLETIDYETFRDALEQIGKHRDEVDRLSKESGRSLTVLRRRLSEVPAVREPEWAKEGAVASSLVPFLLVGTWDKRNETDCVAMSLLANSQSYDELEAEFQRLIRLNDSPVWLAGSFRGVVSKIDLMFAVAWMVTEEDLRRYFSLAKWVLGEEDPALDLPEEDRWAAAIHGKVREFSEAFREGVSQTLVLLALNGNQLFGTRFGIDLELEVSQIIHELLPTPLTTRDLENNDRDLPTYAEAAPDVFLSILEDDLRTDNPAVLGLLKPADGNMLGGHPSRTGLLWALEALSWNPATLHRTALILSRLAQVEINDNWVNKPIHSLEAIFRAWMPQTAADHDERLRVIKLMAEKFPDIAWKVCTAQFDLHDRTGDYSYKPRWRTDGYGYGEPVGTWGPITAFVREMVAMALDWPRGYSLEMLSDLIERLHGLDEDSQSRVWSLVSDWSRDHATDAEKASLREKIRVTIMTRRGVAQSRRTGSDHLSTTAAEIYAALEPEDLIYKHAWLFREHWVEESADEIEEETLDFREREKRIASQRAAALREILSSLGFDGIFELTELGQAAGVIGVRLGQDVLDFSQMHEFILAAFKRRAAADIGKIDSLISGVLEPIRDVEVREELLRECREALGPDDFIRLLLMAPFGQSTWLMAQELGDAAAQSYWKRVIPNWVRVTGSEREEAVEQLLANDRPIAAFEFVRLDLEDLSPALLFRLLTEMAKQTDSEEKGYRIDRHHIEKAFAQIDASPGFSIEQKAGLEFTYLEVLGSPLRDRGEYGIPNIEKVIEKDPSQYVQAIVWTYKRRDGGQDPVELQVPPESVQRFATLGYKLLDALRRIPGHNADGELKANLLGRWIRTVREKCSALGRGEIADVCIGQLLARAPADEEGVWPCDPVRQVLEEVQSRDISRGINTGLYNARGVVWRGEGGAQERELAAKYRGWANELQYTHPFVASTILEEMAKSYDRQASQEDDEAGIRRRLG